MPRYARAACSAQAAVALLLASAAIAGARVAAEELTRTVEFRDGGVLTVTLPDATLAAQVRADGTTSKADLKISDFAQLLFARKPRLAEAVRLSALIEDLGNDDFTTRENAERDLRAAGSAARAELFAADVKQSDPETDARLKRLLHDLPPPSDDDVADGYFDRLIPLNAAAGRAIPQADLGAFSLAATFRGHAITLDRAQVSQIRAVTAASAAAVAAPAARIERIAEDVPGAFGKNATRIDFEKAPDGSQLTPGMDIGQTFVPRGFTLASSYPNSFVSVNNYNVRGPSGGNSCANQNPLWNGIITIRFCVPGQPKVAAGVTAVGFWIAEVSPNGTALEAYDAQDQRIAEIKVVKQGNDFLGVRSTVPIAYVRVVPNLAIDPDYTIDDLVFDTPHPFEFEPDPKFFAVQTRSGDRLLARAVTYAGGKIHVAESTVGIAQLDLDPADVKLVITPENNWRVPALPTGCWLKLKDGSILHATAPAAAAAPGPDAAVSGPVCSRLPLPASAQTLVALWGEAGEFIPLPPKTVIPPGGACYVDRKGSLVFSDWKFGRKFIDEPHFTPAGDPDQRWSPVTYQTAATTWFSPDPVISPEAGRLLLLSGETIILAPSSSAAPAETIHFTLEGWTDRELVLKFGADSLRIPVSEVLVFTPPRR